MDRCSSPRRWTRSGTSQARRREPRACAETRSDDHPGPLRSRVSRVVRLGLASSVARSRVNQYVRTIDCSLTTTNHTCRCAVCASIARLICPRPFLARARNGARTRQSHGQVCGGRATEGYVGCGAARSLRVGQVVLFAPRPCPATQRACEQASPPLRPRPWLCVARACVRPVRLDVLSRRQLSTLAHRLLRSHTRRLLASFARQSPGTLARASLLRPWLPPPSQRMRSTLELRPTAQRCSRCVCRDAHSRDARS